MMVLLLSWLYLMPLCDFFLNRKVASGFAPRYSLSCSSPEGRLKLFGTKGSPDVDNFSLLVTPSEGR